MNCKIQVVDGVTKVYEDNGRESVLFNAALKATNGEVQSALNIWAISNTEGYFDFTNKTTEKSTVEDVQRYLDNQSMSDNEYRMSEKEVTDTKMLLQSTPFKNFTELYEGLSELFKPNGYAELNVKRLVDSGLYSLEEARSLDLNSVNEFINRLGVESTTTTYEVAGENVISNVKDISKPKNALGMHPFVTETEVKQFILENGSAALNESPYVFVASNIENSKAEPTKTFRSKKLKPIEVESENLNKVQEELKETQVTEQNIEELSPELQKALQEELGVTFTQENGELCAAKGAATSFTRGGKWQLKADLGKPDFKDGGTWRMSGALKAQDGMVVSPTFTKGRAWRLVENEIPFTKGQTWKLVE